MFIKHRPYGAFYYYSELIVTFSMTLFFKKKKEKKTARLLAAVCLQICPYLMFLSLNHTQKKKTTPFTARKSQADRRMTFLTAERQEVRKKGREREKGNKEVKRYRQSHKEQPRNLSINVLSHQTPIRSSWQESCQSRRHTVLYE